MKQFYSFLLLTLISVTAYGQNFELGLQHIATTSTKHQIALTLTADQALNSEAIGAGTYNLYVPAGITVSGFTSGNSGMSAQGWQVGATVPAGSTTGNDPVTPAGKDRIIIALDPNFTAFQELILNTAPGQTVQLILFDVDNAGSAPTTGEIELVDAPYPAYDTNPNFFESSTSSEGFYFAGSNASSNIINFNSLSVATAEFQGLAIYPNPVKDVLNINGVQGLTNVSIFNINGQEVLRATNNVNTIDLSNLQSGVYFAQLKTANSNKIVKIIKE